MRKQICHIRIRDIT